ncbi:hypothetical protein [Fluviicola taffensis]|uniref:Uncharacterized protein n=1 Tax=Fluviicola taffensis (strain DSM 16823 / NCIMB 13979 / RW262) TaxID=755732 RepID=F2IDW7_FLUTR|nr:hypothetical protein [Fluviicola taffensis]AEA44509.1 hypothetical protein Fluta_2524 [Fluviicola taffensis DSM 16823]
MKHFNLSSVLMAGALLIFSTSCKKDKTQPTTPDPTNPATNYASAFFNSNLSNGKQTFTINAGQTQTITGNKGTVIHFNPNSFVTASGTPVTGNIQIEFVEIYSKKDMILMNKQTVGKVWNGVSPLISGGQFNIVAKQNGQNLKLAPGANYLIEAPAPNGTTNQMGLFYGQIDNEQLEWTQVDSSNMSAGTGIYSAFPDSLGWVNLDYFMNNSEPLSKIDVQIPSGFTTQNTRVFVSVDGASSMGGIYQVSSGIFHSGGYKLPIGMNVHFIIINLDNNEIHAAVIPAAITTDHFQTVGSLNLYSLAQLEALLNNLP